MTTETYTQIEHRPPLNIQLDRSKWAVNWRAMAEWIGALTALAGTTMLALHAAWSGWGFGLYLISNLCWIGYGMKTRTFSIVVMQAGFTVTSLLGLYCWM
jgi:hypothetical protein